MPNFVRIGVPLVRGLCVKTHPGDGRILYSPKYLMQKSKEYLRVKDVGQACEKAFRAAELVLIQHVQDVESLNQVDIVLSADSWNRFMLDKLVGILAKKCVAPNDRKSFLGVWDMAVRFHIDGWKLNVLTVDHVEPRIEYIEDFICMVNSLPKDKSVADLLEAKLFPVDITKIVFRLKEIAAEDKNDVDEAKEKKVIYEFLELMRIKTSLRNDQKLTISENLILAEKEILKKRFGRIVGALFFGG